MKNKKIVIAGGTGFIGQALVKHFGTDNEIVILSRQVKGTNNSYDIGEDAIIQPGVKLVIWDAKTQGDWSRELDGSDLVINLCGKSVNCRYNAKNKQEIFDSRIQSTNAIGEAIRQATRPPKLWINAASATIYRDATDRPQDEATGEIKDDFSVRVCKVWEKTFFENRTPFIRKVALRMAISLGMGGVMTPYFNLLKCGLGGRQGSGRQMYSWVHVQDVCRMMEWAFDNQEVEGVYNCSSPNPLPNKVFMRTLRNIAGYKFGFPAYEWVLKIGAAIIGTETELILKSRWVVPTKALEAEFTFQYPLLGDALREIISRTPRKRYHLL
ncbi:MAG: TIGR01777 family oxidoreductase [Chitinophagaceae bacterium]